LFDPTVIYETVQSLKSSDESVRQVAHEKVRGMGVEALPYIARTHNSSLDALVRQEMLRAFVAIGDDLFAAGGQKEIDLTILNPVKFAAKSTRNTTQEANQIARQALARWGFEVPELSKPPEVRVQHCHVCQRPSTQVKIQRCFLPSCSKFVCQDHAHILKGSERSWFCTAEHKNEANRNPSVWQ